MNPDNDRRMNTTRYHPDEPTPHNRITPSWNRLSSTQPSALARNQVFEQAHQEDQEAPQTESNQEQSKQDPYYQTYQPNNSPQTTVPPTPSSLSEEEELTMELMEGFSDDFVPQDRIIDTPTRQFWDLMQQRADYVLSMHKTVEAERQALKNKQRLTELPTHNPVALTRLKVLGEDLSRDDYAKLLDLPDPGRLQKIYEATIGKSLRSNSKLVSEQEAALPNHEDPYNSQNEESSQNSAVENERRTNERKLQMPSSQTSPENTNEKELELNSLSSEVGMTSGSDDNQSKNVSSNSNELAKTAKSTVDDQSEEANRKQEVLWKPLFREGEESEYNLTFDLYTTDSQKKRDASKYEREKDIYNAQIKSLRGAEQKTGYLKTEKEAKDVRKAMVAVQYKEGGDFKAIPDGFDPQKDKYHIIKLDTRLLFEDSAQARAHEMVDLLYRVRTKEGDAQRILDMKDKKERMRLIRMYTKGRRYSNTPIDLPTSGLPANVNRYASPQYINATPEERKEMEENDTHFADSLNVDENSENPYLYIKSVKEGSATFDTNAMYRKSSGFDIKSPMGYDLPIDENETITSLQWYATTQAVHGGALDWSLPEFKNEKGEVISSAMNVIEYAKLSRAYLNSSLQAILHEAYHSRTNAPLLYGQSQYENDAAEKQILNTNMSRIPGVSDELHASSTAEMLNSVHALKRFMREGFPNETLQSSDDFEFIYHSIWRPNDQSDLAARMRASIPRDARIVFAVYSYIELQNKIRTNAYNRFIKNQREILKKHPELEEFDDVFLNLDNYIETFTLGTESDGKLDPNLREIVKYFYFYNINNLDNKSLFKQWFKKNDVFKKAYNLSSRKM